MQSRNACPSFFKWELACTHPCKHVCFEVRLSKYTNQIFIETQVCQHSGTYTTSVCMDMYKLTWNAYRELSFAIFALWPELKKYFNTDCIKRKNFEFILYKFNSVSETSWFHKLPKFQKLFRLFRSKAVSN